MVVRLSPDAHATLICHLLAAHAVSPADARPLFEHPTRADDRRRTGRGRRVVREPVSHRVRYWLTVLHTIIPTEDEYIGSALQAQVRIALFSLLLAGTELRRSVRLHSGVSASSGSISIGVPLLIRSVKNAVMMKGLSTSNFTTTNRYFSVTGVVG